MIEKPKRKVEDIARRRVWMGRIRAYLIVLLIGVVIIGLHHNDPIPQLGLVIGLFVALFTIFTLVWVIPDEPLCEQSVNGRVALGWMVGMLVSALMPAVLWKLGA